MAGRLPPRWPRDTFNEHGYPRLATAIGKVAIAFNALHEQLASIFWSLMGDSGYRRPAAVWASVNFDRPKREMLRAAVKAASKDELETFPKMKDDLVWLLNVANEIEEIRNNAIHSPLISLGRFGVFPDIAHDNVRAQKILDKDLLVEFEWCRAQIVVLRDFAMDIDLALRSKSGTWPERPRMPNREQKKRRVGRRPQGAAK